MSTQKVERGRGGDSKKTAKGNNSFPVSSPPTAVPLLARYPCSKAREEDSQTLQQPSSSCFSFLSQYLSTEQEEMPHPQTGQKGSAGLLQCPKILLTCFRERISAPRSLTRSLHPILPPPLSSTGTHTRNKKDMLRLNQPPISREDPS